MAIIPNYEWDLMNFVTTAVKVGEDSGWDEFYKSVNQTGDLARNNTLAYLTQVHNDLNALLVGPGGPLHHFGLYYQARALAMPQGTSNAERMKRYYTDYMGLMKRIMADVHNRYPCLKGILEYSNEQRLKEDVPPK